MDIKDNDKTTIVLNDGDSAIVVRKGDIWESYMAKAKDDQDIYPQSAYLVALCIVIFSTDRLLKFAEEELNNHNKEI